MTVPLIISITVLVLSFCFLIYLVTRMKKVVNNEKGAAILHGVYKLIVTPGAIVFIFSLLTIFVYKIR